jgi:lipoprotein NlpD
MRAVILAVLFLLLSGCGAHYAPVRDGTLGAPEVPIDGKHTVQSGESLYAIAWRYHRDFREIAALNNIQSPYTIYPGQELQITGEAPVAVAAIEPVPTFTEPAPFVTEPVTTQTEPAPITTTAANTAQPVTTESQAPIAEQPTPPKPTIPPPATTPNVTNWIWPAQGKVISGYGRKNKGVDISGVMGEPIYATAGGQVVYSGTGLRGYGRLVIIKHNADYLSAYAHNSQILVAEGDTVTQGQKIAEMGDSGTNTVKLHFELRYHGRPVDPQKYLPQR